MLPYFDLRKQIKDVCMYVCMYLVIGLLLFLLLSVNHFTNKLTYLFQPENMVKIGAGWTYRREPRPTARRQHSS